MRKIIIFAMLIIFALLVSGCLSNTNTNSVNQSRTDIQPASSDGSPSGFGASGSNPADVYQVITGNNANTSSEKTVSLETKTSNPNQNKVNSTATKSEDSDTYITTNSGKSKNVMKEITVRGIPVMPISSYPEVFQDNVAYIRYQEINFRRGSSVTVSFIVSKDKLKDISIFIDDRMVLNNFQTETSNGVKTLTVSSRLPKPTGEATIYAGTRDGNEWRKFGTMGTLRAPQENAVIWQAGDNIPDEFYKIESTIMYYQ